MWELFGISLVLALPVAAIALPIWLLNLNRRNREALDRLNFLERRQQEDATAIEALRQQVARLRNAATPRAGSPHADHFGKEQSTAEAPVSADGVPVNAPQGLPVQTAVSESVASEIAPPPAPPLLDAPKAAVPPPPPPPVAVPTEWTGSASESAGSMGTPPPPRFAHEPTVQGLPLDAPAVAFEPSSVQDSPAPDWETRVGANWLSKLGVAAMVIGLALFVGYSFTTMGAVGRIAMAALLSAAMLGGGILFERRPQFQILGRGLIAGGWAGAYLTTFAAYGVEAARVLTSPGLATALLFVVALGMIAHSLRYQSQALTTLAFTLAALALGVSDSFGFAIGALFPLAGALLVTAHRLTWPILRVVGAGACYVVVAVLLFFGSQLMTSPMLNGALIALWALFEFAAWVAIRRGEAPGVAPMLLGSGNAVSFVVLLAANGGVPEVGAGETPHFQFSMLIGALLMALSACVRAWLARTPGSFSAADDEKSGTLPQPVDVEEEGLGDHLARGGYLSFAALGSTCSAALILLRYAGAVELGLLMGLGGLLLALAVGFHQRYLARLADGVFSFSLLRVYTGNLPSEPLFQFAGSDWTARSLFALGHAAVFYVNRSLFPRRAYYSIVATLILLVTLAEALPPLWLSFAYLIVMLGLLEAARRSRLFSSVLEAWGALIVAVFACAFTWLEHETQASLPWQPVVATALLFYIGVWQLWRSHRSVFAADEPKLAATLAEQGTLIAAGVCAALAVYLLVPDVWLCAAWVLLALIWSELGMRFRGGVWAAKAYLLSTLGILVMLVMGYDLRQLPWQQASFWLVHLMPSAALFAMWWRVTTVPTDGRVAGFAAVLGWLPSALGTVVLATLVRNVADGVWIGLLWLLLSLGLVLSGISLRKKVLRVEGYLLAFLGAGQSALLLADATGNLIGVSQQVVAGVLGTGGLLALFMATLRLVKRPDDAATSAFWAVERYVPPGLALAAGAYAIRVMYLVVEGRLFTICLGFEAIALLGLGIFANLRALRLGALGLLLFAVAKLFLYDLASLVMPYRIASFFILGGLLLAVSWAYSRFGDRIRRLL